MSEKAKKDLVNKALEENAQKKAEKEVRFKEKLNKASDYIEQVFIQLEERYNKKPKQQNEGEGNE